MTISFGIGQTLGPIAVGAVTDALGSLTYALNVSAAMLALGAVLAGFQKKLRVKSLGGQRRALRAVPTILSVQQEDGGHAIVRAFARPLALPTLHPYSLFATHHSPLQLPLNEL